MSKIKIERWKTILKIFTKSCLLILITNGFLSLLSMNYVANQLGIAATLLSLATGIQIYDSIVNIKCEGLTLINAEDYLDRPFHRKCLVDLNCSSSP